MFAIPLVTNLVISFMSTILSALLFMIIFNFNMSFYMLPPFYQKCFQCKCLILSQMFLILPSINLGSFCINHFLCKIFHEIVNFNVFVYLFLDFYQKYFPCKSSMLSENVYNSTFNQLRIIFILPT